MRARVSLSGVPAAANAGRLFSELVSSSQRHHLVWQSKCIATRTLLPERPRLPSAPQAAKSAVLTSCARHRTPAPHHLHTVEQMLRRAHHLLDTRSAATCASRNSISQNLSTQFLRWTRSLDGACVAPLSRPCRAMGRSQNLTRLCPGAIGPPYSSFTSAPAVVNSSICVRKGPHVGVRRQSHENTLQVVRVQTLTVSF